MLLLFTLISCSSTPAPETRPAEDLLLIVLDTFRADQVTPNKAPNIHQHAVESWWPRSAWAPSPWTVPSLSALLTGKPPWELTSPEDHGLPDQATSLPERLEQHTSAMFSTNPYVTESRGFAQGFDDFYPMSSDEEAVEASADWWEEHREQPKFLAVVLMSAHLPYEPKRPPVPSSPRVGEKFWDLDNWQSYTDPADRNQIRRLYTAQVPDLDQHVSRLLDLAEPNTTVAIVSDHGEELFENGGFEHGHAFWEEVTRVHAAIRFPGEPPSRPQGLWTLQDIGQLLIQRFDASESTAPPAPRTRVLHGYPLSYRVPVLHTWGIRSETDAYFDGIRPHQTLGGAKLVPELEAFVAALQPSNSPQGFQSSEAENAALEALGYQATP